MRRAKIRPRRCLNGPKIELLWRSGGSFWRLRPSEWGRQTGFNRGMLCSLGLRSATPRAWQRQRTCPAMERNLLLIALRRANYAHLRALRSRRQQLDIAWADGWVVALLPATTTPVCSAERARRARLQTLLASTLERWDSEYRPDGLAALPSRCRADCTCWECRDANAGNA
jgi:hypothetical protein